MPTCLFCPNEDLTREHIWPDWLVKEFSKRLPKRKGLFTATVTHGGKIVRQFPANDITEKRRIVCEPCNSVWMSQLENLTKPILLPLILHADTPKYLSVLDQCTIAAWMTLRSMVFDAISPLGQGGQYYSREERAAFANSTNLAPPPNTMIWLAPHIGKRWSVHFDGLNYVNSAQDDGYHVVTCLMNEIAIQLLTWKGSRRRTINAAKLNKDGWNTATMRVWPCRKRPLPWPTSAHLNSEGLQSFFDRFKPPRPKS